MIQRILIIGGYGNFGRFISTSLAMEANIQIIISGRSLEKAQKLADELTASSDTVNPPETECVDINNDFNQSLAFINPDIVIHTSGPFQAQGYSVAESCIDRGIHYIDLADAREFVVNISSLQARAKDNNVVVISGASSVPCLTSAVIDHYIDEFDALESVDYGISTAQKTARGGATTAAILGYTGKGFNTLVNGEVKEIYGWQNIHARKYKHLGWRLLGNCDIPDLSIFPLRYPHLKNIRFYAGLEIPFIHISLWCLSWLVRIRLIRRLDKAAALLLKLSFMFDWLGTSNSAFHMELSGIDSKQVEKQLNFQITARSGDGPYIPCMPAILLAKKIVNNQIIEKGAYACVGFIALDEYLEALSALDISWEVESVTNNR